MPATMCMYGLSCSNQSFWYFVDDGRHGSYEFLTSILALCLFCYIDYVERKLGRGRKDRHDSCFLSISQDLFSMAALTEGSESSQKKEILVLTSCVICPLMPKSPKDFLPRLKSIFFLISLHAPHEVVVRPRGHTSTSPPCLLISLKRLFLSYSWGD